MSIFDEIKSANIEQVKKILKMAPIAANTFDRFGNPPLSLAVQNNNSKMDEIAELLLMAGANPRHYDATRGHTLLQLAVINNRVKIAKLLLLFGADKRTKDEFGDTLQNYEMSTEMRKVVNKKMPNC